MIATVGLASSANAALYVQSFDYGGAVLDFGNDLAGDGWTDSSGLVTYDPSAGLTYANHVGNTGGAWQMDWIDSGSRQATQNITDIDLVGTSGQVSYFFALGKAVGSTAGSVLAFEAVGSVNDITFNYDGSQISATVFGAGASAVTSTGQTVSVGDTFAILVKATQQANASPTASTIEVWLNPDLVNLGTADLTTASKFGRHGASEAMSSVLYQSTGPNDFVWDEAIWTTDFNAIAVPEPGTTTLLGLGAIALIFRRRK